MLRILIADDESFIRNGLSAMINDSGLGFEVAGTASNGAEALELAAGCSPDVVVTDIKMPGMDGVELIRILETKYPGIRKIVLSGFDDFNYVRETMKRGAVDYLLKPVDEKQLMQLLVKISRDIENERLEELDSINQKIKLDESMPLLREKFLKELICENGSVSISDLEGKLRNYEIKTGSSEYFVILACIENARYLYEKSGAEEFKISSFIVKNIAEESAERHAGCISFQCDHGLAMVCSTNGRPYFEVCGGILRDTFDNLARNTDIRFSLTAGMPVDNFFILNKSYESAIKALSLRFYREGSCIVNFDDALKQDFTSCPTDMPDELRAGLGRCIEACDTGKIGSVFEDFCQKARDKSVRPNDVIKAFSDTYVRLEVENVRFREAAAEAFGFSYSYSKSLDLFDTLDEIRNYTLGVYDEILRKMAQIIGKKDRRIIQQVKDYIEKHYNEEINLNRIAETVYINPNYLSELFKSQTGENFVDYFTRVRIEKAKLLLKDIKIKAYEIGDLVGYDDPAYFSKVFKKIVGVSPTEYRNIVR